MDPRLYSLEWKATSGLHGSHGSSRFPDQPGCRAKRSRSHPESGPECVGLLVSRTHRGELDWIGGFTPAKRSAHVPTVMSVAEAQVVFANLSGVYRLVGQVLYGSGLRLMEALRLRVNLK